MIKTDIAVVGAGPYGLSAAAHLRTIKGLDVRVFGEPMSFWQRNMPEGMLLRSNWTATQIGSPGSALSLEAYQQYSGEKFSMPVPLKNFINYGRWYQESSIPDLDGRFVHRIEPHAKGFRITLSDGESLVSRRVVVAAGISPFAWRPKIFENVEPTLVTHTSEHQNLRCLAEKTVLVIGSGQSALESAALLQEVGSHVEVVARAQCIHWLGGWLSTTLHHRLGMSVRHLLYAPTDVGPAGISQLCARPQIMRSLPPWLHHRIWKRAVRPAGARWLVSRLEDVPIKLGRSVASVRECCSRLSVRLDDGTERVVDHIMLGTGYKVDISRYKFIAPELLASISRSNGYPRLGDGLETSVPGLHILGAPAACSFGPLMQFVSGTTYVGNALTRFVLQRKS